VRSALILGETSAFCGPVSSGSMTPPGARRRLPQRIVARIASTTAGGRALVIAGAIIGGIVVLYFIGRARNVTEGSLAAVEEEAA
jgi:hypothetical protein